MPRGERKGSPDTHAGHQYVYAKLFDGFADYVCAETGVVNLSEASRTVDPLHASFLQLGFPRKVISVLTAAALRDIPEVKAEFSSLSPERFG